MDMPDDGVLSTFIRTLLALASDAITGAAAVTRTMLV
jgi:hypothetical protein